MTKYFPVLLLIWALAACQKQTDSSSTENQALLYQEIKNESYGSDAAQKADIYLPAGRSTATKVAILLHGGAWNSGDKSDLNEYVVLLRAKYPELAVVNANYRLAGPSTRHPAQMEDLRTLLDYLVSKSNTWKISNQHYALGGVSAGGHLALLYAYQHDPARQIKVVLSIVGPTYFLDPYYTSNPLYQPIIINFIGRPISDSASYRNASPAYVVAAGAPPTYMAYGGADPLVPVSNATLLDQRLTALNVPHQYDFFPNEGHTFTLPTYDTVARKMVAFLKQYQ